MPFDETKTYRQCGLCRTWNTSPCGEQCGWSLDDPPFVPAPQEAAQDTEIARDKEISLLKERLRAALDDAPRALKLERERAEQAERERDELRTAHSALEKECDRLQGFLDDAEAVRAERDTEWERGESMADSGTEYDRLKRQKEAMVTRQRDALLRNLKRYRSGAYGAMVEEAEGPYVRFDAISDALAGSGSPTQEG